MGSGTSPPTYFQPERASDRKGAGREPEPSGGTWGERARGEGGGECPLPAKVSEVSFWPAGNPAQRRVLPQIQTFAGSSGWRRRRPWREPGPVARSVGARGCGGRSLRERLEPPRSRPAPGSPARLARSRLSPLPSRGIVFPRPPPPPPAGLGHATFRALRPPAPRLLRSSAAPSPPQPSPPVPKEKRASGEGGDQQPGGVGDPRRRTPGGVWRAGRAGLRRPGADCADPSVGRCAWLSPSAAPVPRGSGGCSDLTAAWIRRGRAL